MTTSAITLQDLTAALCQTFLPLGPEERRLHVRLLRLLAGGEPVSPERLAQSAGVEQDRAARFVAERAERRWAYLDEAGRVIGFCGVALQAITPHHITVDGRELYAWCALDTLLLPPVLGQPRIDVRSVCPQTKAPIELTVSPERVESVTPAGAVLSLPTRAPEQMREDVFESFCGHVHVFSSERAGRDWQATHAGLVLLPIEDGFVVGRECVRAVFGDLAEL